MARLHSLCEFDSSHSTLIWRPGFKRHLFVNRFPRERSNPRFYVALRNKDRDPVTTLKGTCLGLYQSFPECILILA